MRHAWPWMQARISASNDKAETLLSGCLTRLDVCSWLHGKDAASPLELLLIAQGVRVCKETLKS